MGHSRRFRPVRATSAIHPIATGQQTSLDVRNVPKAAIGHSGFSQTFSAGTALQFGAIPSDFTSGRTISTSALINVRSSSGVAVLVSTPLSCSRAASRGSREAMMNSLFKRSTIAFGVPAGADTAYQPLAFFLS